jgi:hypothetical protein
MCRGSEKQIGFRRNLVTARVSLRPDNTQPILHANRMVAMRQSTRDLTELAVAIRDMNGQVVSPQEKRAYKPTQHALVREPKQQQAAEMKPVSLSYGTSRSTGPTPQETAYIYQQQPTQPPVSRLRLLGSGQRVGGDQVSHAAQQP